MIQVDQPTCFPEHVIVKVSAKDDGSLLDRTVGIHHMEFLKRRQEFCGLNGISYEQTVYQRIVYDEKRTYELIAEVDAGSTTEHTTEVVADALYTKQKNVALFLPVADCIATVVYDPNHNVLALAHLGRHSTYAKLATRLIRHFIVDGSQPQDLIVWMSPHAKKEHYRLDWFDKSDDPDWHGFFEERDGGVYLDMAGFNRQLFEREGVLPEAIHVSPIDTMSDDNYFSHLGGETHGRIAVLAMLK